MLVSVSDDVTSNEYVHAIVRVQVMVYVNDVDMSRVFVSIQGSDSTKDSVTVSDSSSVKDSNICVMSEVKVWV